MESVGFALANAMNDMTTNTPEALEVADDLENHVETGGRWSRDRADRAAALLRHQHEQLASKDKVIEKLVEALRDMNNGWKYIREFHGDLYGVGWDRAGGKADAALKLAKEQ